MITEQIDKGLEWICDNKEWIFSGIGGTVGADHGKRLCLA